MPKDIVMLLGVVYGRRQVWEQGKLYFPRPIMFCIPIVLGWPGWLSFQKRNLPRDIRERLISFVAILRIQEKALKLIR